MVRSFDLEVTETLVKAADPDSEHVFWDVGANKGACSYSISALLPQAKIVAIEPQSALKANNLYNLNQICPDRFEYFQYGISTEELTLELFIPDNNAGKASLHIDHAGVNDRVEHIQIITAQSLVDQSKYGWPTLVKIDVEGHEPMVIESLRPALEQQACQAVVFECLPSDSKNFKNIESIAEKTGYAIFGIAKSVLSTSLVPTHSPISGINDYVIVPKSTIVQNRSFRSMIR